MSTEHPPRPFPGARIGWGDAGAVPDRRPCGSLPACAENNPTATHNCFAYLNPPQPKQGIPGSRRLRVSDPTGLPRSAPAGLKPARNVPHNLVIRMLSWFSISKLYALGYRNVQRLAYPTVWAVSPHWRNPLQCPAQQGSDSPWPEGRGILGDLGRRSGSACRKPTWPRSVAGWPTPRREPPCWSSVERATAKPDRPGRIPEVSGRAGTD
jgi:hypothetical protein